MHPDAVLEAVYVVADPDLQAWIDRKRSVLRGIVENTLRAAGLLGVEELKPEAVKTGVYASLPRPLERMDLDEAIDALGIDRERSHDLWQRIVKDHAGAIARALSEGESGKSLESAMDSTDTDSIFEEGIKLGLYPMGPDDGSANVDLTLPRAAFDLQMSFLDTNAVIGDGIPYSIQQELQAKTNATPMIVRKIEDNQWEVLEGGKKPVYYRMSGNADKPQTGPKTPISHDTFAQAAAKYATGPLVEKVGKKGEIERWVSFNRAAREIGQKAGRFGREAAPAREPIPLFGPRLAPREPSPVPPPPPAKPRALPPPEPGSLEAPIQLGTTALPPYGAWPGSGRAEPYLAVQAFNHPIQFLVSRAYQRDKTGIFLSANSSKGGPYAVGPFTDQAVVTVGMLEAQVIAYYPKLSADERLILFGRALKRIVEEKRGSLIHQVDEIESLANQGYRVRGNVSNYGIGTVQIESWMVSPFKDLGEIAAKQKRALRDVRKRDKGAALIAADKALTEAIQKVVVVTGQLESHVRPVVGPPKEQVAPADFESPAQTDAGLERVHILHHEIVQDLNNGKLDEAIRRLPELGDAAFRVMGSAYATGYQSGSASKAFEGMKERIDKNVRARQTVLEQVQWDDEELRRVEASRSVTDDYGDRSGNLDKMAESYAASKPARWAEWQAEMEYVDRALAQKIDAMIERGKVQASRLKTAAERQRIEERTKADEEARLAAGEEELKKRATTIYGWKFGDGFDWRKPGQFMNQAIWYGQNEFDGQVVQTYAREVPVSRVKDRHETGFMFQDRKDIYTRTAKQDYHPVPIDRQQTFHNALLLALDWMEGKAAQAIEKKRQEGEVWSKLAEADPFSDQPHLFMDPKEQKAWGRLFDDMILDVMGHWETWLVPLRKREFKRGRGFAVDSSNPYDVQYPVAVRFGPENAVRPATVLPKKALKEGAIPIEGTYSDDDIPWKDPLWKPPQMILDMDRGLQNRRWTSFRLVDRDVVIRKKPLNLLHHISAFSGQMHREGLNTVSLQPWIWSNDLHSWPKLFDPAPMGILVATDGHRAHVVSVPGAIRQDFYSDTGGTYKYQIPLPVAADPENEGIVYVTPAEGDGRPAAARSARALGIATLEFPLVQEVLRTVPLPQNGRMEEDALAFMAAMKAPKGARARESVLQFNEDGTATAFWLEGERDTTSVRVDLTPIRLRRPLGPNQTVRLNLGYFLEMCAAFLVYPGGVELSINPAKEVEVAFQKGPSWQPQPAVFVQMHGYNLRQLHILMPKSAQ